ncbi:MAG: hypothetical protein V2A34_07815 [Lentisphaerota bacterium]
MMEYLDYMLVALIVGAAAIYLVRSLRRSLSARQAGSACACKDSGCPLASSCSPSGTGARPEKTDADRGKT